MILVEQIHPFDDLIIFLFGLVMGSFSNVCIARIPHRESVVSPPSHCRSCGEKIRVIHNIPLVSFLILRGRCASCGDRISPRYFLVELLTALLYLELYLQFGLSWHFLLYLALTSALIIISFIDLEHTIVPNVITLPGIPIGLVLSPLLLRIGFLNALFGMIIGGGLFYLIAIVGPFIFKKEVMGGGDVKLIAMIGAFLGWQPTILTIFLSAFTGSIVGLLMIALKRKGRGDEIPYGPFISLGALISIFWGNDIIRWYLT